MMLDEIDKLGSGIQGDPASALLEVLDPEQNGPSATITWACRSTCRRCCSSPPPTYGTVPGPLRDRMEVIELSGYTEDEKLQIAKRYLVPRQQEANGVAPAMRRHRRRAAADHPDYTREAGVRTLERTIGGVFRNSAMRIARAPTGTSRSGRTSFRRSSGAALRERVAMRTSVPVRRPRLDAGRGDILFIEATRTPARASSSSPANWRVMKEMRRRRCRSSSRGRGRMGIDETLFPKATSTSTCRPAPSPRRTSAGVAMTVALVSLMTGGRRAATRR